MTVTLYIIFTQNGRMSLGHPAKTERHSRSIYYVEANTGRQPKRGHKETWPNIHIIGVTDRKREPGIDNLLEEITTD